MIDRNIPLPQLAEETARKFQLRYGRSPRWMVAAPGRVNIIGEHTDYNDGYVLPMAIERYAVIAADRRANPQTLPAHRISWYSVNLGKTAYISLHPPLTPGKPRWANYVRGVIAGFQSLGYDAGPLDVLLHSNVPLGGGLSSSAALEVATATLIEAVTGHTLDPIEKALLCQKAEHDYAGVPCGIMDQFASTLGRRDHLLLLDCQSRIPELVPMGDPDVEVLIVNTNVRHHLASGEYSQRRAQCEAAARALGVRSLRQATPELLASARHRLDQVTFRRAKHVISEIERTLEAAQAIRTANWPLVGQLMYASHFSLRDDYAVSCPELDAVVDIARSVGLDGGVIGCRMTGAGFGGCAVCLARTTAIPEIARRLSTTYKQLTSIEPSLFVSRPAAGASVLKA
jgi:galactokinase